MQICTVYNGVAASMSVTQTYYQLLITRACFEGYSSDHIDLPLLQRIHEFKLVIMNILHFRSYFGESQDLKGLFDSKVY